MDNTDGTVQRKWVIELDNDTLYLDGEEWCGEDFAGREDGWLCQDSDGRYCEAHQGMYQAREQKYWGSRFYRERAEYVVTEENDRLAYGDSYKSTSFMEALLDRADAERKS